MSIGRALTHLADAAPDAVAVRCGDAILKRRELDRVADGVARAWAERVGHDDLVTIALPNGIDFVVACVATWKLGATPQPLSPRIGPGERAAVLDLARPALVVDAELVRAGGLVPSDDDTPLPDLVASSWKAPTTSGSTGRPKIVRSTTPATVDPTAAIAPFVPRHAVQLVAGPMFHAAPFVYAMRGLMTGHELVMLPRFDAAAALQAIERHRVTWTMLVPTMMQRIWRLEGREAHDVSSLESVLHLGARCAPWLKRSWIEWLGPDRVVEVYAGTESQGIAMITGNEWLAHPGSVGGAVSGSEFRIVRLDGTVAAPDERGEIVMRRQAGPTYQYVGAEPHVRDGWHTLGDAGWMDSDGYLFVADRLDDVIVTGGATVQPADVEAVLDEHPAVRSSVVVPRPHGDLGQAVHAVVDVAAGEVTVAELAAWTRARLDPEKVPRSWQLVRDELRDDTGKVRRRDHR
ncbi:AMP-binding protein [Aeromicrobium fastidiosum]|uniref:AMP-binding protein n=1 Tax=Aeromicrobium fastidiosum TaxID=52699 RepID=A0A641AJZ1_9ACTN|nr:AMP-binding protein [Aeromicrobium fastidiosum]KAA1372465.1 AMP-binding protein [Aeromicrobium fastidiosum]MBP2391457.1 bile acid-coenzyme A ligase [Aeromicrobium fastidiosum]